MNKTSASRPTSKRLRFSGAFILLLIAALACSLPIGVDTSQPASAPESATGPSVTIQTPLPGARVTVGESFDILATATDPSGVARLDLFIDGTLILSQPAPDANGLATLSLMYPLVATNSGSYALIVRAYNSKGEASDSAIHYVTVSDTPSASSAAPDYAQYLVQAGDTLENIAQRLGISVDDLQKANPAIQNGQVAVGQVIRIPLNAKPVVQAAVPAPGGGAQPVGQPVNRPGGGQPGGGAGNQPPANPPGNQPPASPPTATPSANQPPANPPGNPGGIPPGGPIINVPGILPIFLPGPVQIPVLPPGAFPDPILFPAGNVINNLPNMSFAPNNAQALSGDCQVTLTWNDNASSETMYRVWRVEPGAPSPNIIARLDPDTVQFKDTLKRAGTYMYEIEYYYRELAADQKTIKLEVRERSAPIWVEVPVSANCPDGSAKRVMFEPVFFAPSDLSMKVGFLNVTIGNFSAIRIPRGQQTTIPVGMQWDAADDRWVIPMTNLEIMKAGDSLRVEVQGNAQIKSDSDIIFLLGQVAASHTYESLVAANAKDQIWELQNGSMTVRYKIWLEDWQWGGKMASNELPVPYALALKDYTSSKVLTWSVDASAPPNHDGFIVYGNYTCSGPGQPTQTQRIVVKTQTEFTGVDEPLGCTCSYQVSSFGAAGESKLSAPNPEPNCKTLTPHESVSVTFESLKINNLAQPLDAIVTVYANNSTLKSGNSWFPSPGIFTLAPISLKGSRLEVNFVTGQSRAIQVGFAVGGLCRGQMVFGERSPSWPAEPQLFTIVSADRNCEVNVSIQRKTP